MHVTEGQYGTLLGCVEHCRTVYLTLQDSTGHCRTVPWRTVDCITVRGHATAVQYMPQQNSARHCRAEQDNADPYQCQGISIRLPFTYIYCNWWQIKLTLEAMFRCFYQWDPVRCTLFLYTNRLDRARVFKHLKSPWIDSKEPILPGCVTWRAGTPTLFLVGS